MLVSLALQIVSAKAKGDDCPTISNESVAEFKSSVQRFVSFIKLSSSLPQFSPPTQLEATVESVPVSRISSESDNIVNQSKRVISTSHSSVHQPMSFSAAPSPTISPSSSHQGSRQHSASVSIPRVPPKITAKNRAETNIENMDRPFRVRTKARLRESEQRSQLAQKVSQKNRQVLGELFVQGTPRSTNTLVQSARQSNERASNFVVISRNNTGNTSASVDSSSDDVKSIEASSEGEEGYNDLGELNADGINVDEALQNLLAPLLM